MIEWFQSKLGKIAGGIIGYLVNLIVSPILLLIATLIQPFVWLDFTWALPNTGLGFTAGMIFILLGGEVKPQWFKCARVVAPSYMGSFGAFSLGPVLNGSHSFSHWDHEYGHTWQSRILGPFYVFVIALPSLLSASGVFGNTHGDFYTEKWADSWSSWT